MTDKRLPGAQRRMQIADAALRVIGSQGIAALTTATLAKEAGLTSGALFRHFASREAILVAVARRAAELIEATLPDPGLPPLERLTRLARARTAMMETHPGLVSLVFSVQFTLALPEEALTYMRQVVVRTRQLVTDALHEAAAAGLIRQDVAVSALVPVVIGTLQHLAFRSAAPEAALMGREQAELEAIWATLQHLFKPAETPNA